MEPDLIGIGDHVSITNNVRFITHADGGWIARNELPKVNGFGKIRIGDNSFVGVYSIILIGRSEIIV